MDLSSNKKGSVAKRENQKKKNSIFNAISSWIFSSDKKEGKRSKGASWISSIWNSKKKKNDEKGSSWLESMSSWVSKKKGGKDSKNK